MCRAFATRGISRAYARRLLLLACVSEIPFDLLIFGQISSAMEQNVVFALLLGLMALYAAKALAARPCRARWPF
ncbi:MAG: TraX family protein [Christensenellales bacterium]